MLHAATSPAGELSSIPEPTHHQGAGLDPAGSVYYEAEDSEQEPQVHDKPAILSESVSLSHKAEGAIQAGKIPARREAKSSEGGVHRFTFVNQNAIKKAKPVKVKKQSACTWTFPLQRRPLSYFGYECYTVIKGFNRLLSPGGADKVRCAVCGRRIMKDNYMQCDDCNSQLESFVSTACSIADAHDLLFDVVNVHVRSVQCWCTPMLEAKDVDSQTDVLTPLNAIAGLDLGRLRSGGQGSS